MSKRSYPSGAEKRKRAAVQKSAIKYLSKLTSFWKEVEVPLPVRSACSSENNIVIADCDTAVDAAVGFDGVEGVLSECALETGTGNNECALRLGCGGGGGEGGNRGEDGDNGGVGVRLDLLSSTTENAMISASVEHQNQSVACPSSFEPTPPPSVAGNIDISRDPGDWETLTEEDRASSILKGPAYFQNLDADFSEAAKSYDRGNKGKTVNRSLGLDVFVKTLKNGEKRDRKWLLYSPKKKSVFCYSCRLFNSNVASLSSSTGCNDWKHIHDIIDRHENTPGHRDSVIIYLTRSKIVGRVDVDLSVQFNNKVGYWKNVLRRIVSVVKFLASRGLAFRGANQTIGSPENGNYLGCLELLSEYDPFLADHIKSYGNKGKGHASYLSANTCDEFISLMSKQLLLKIASEVREAKYFSISVDSTPDFSHVDQLTFIIRYVSGDQPVERFLTFIPVKEHKAEYLSGVVLTELEKQGIEIKDCRGRSYDNANNMAGPYSGVQARIKEKCPEAIFVPCAGHSLNLVGVHAAGCVLAATDFFQFVQKLYVFFSSSTHRWAVMRECLGMKKVLKSLSETRWSARADAVCAKRDGYENIMGALRSIHEDTNQRMDTRNEAVSLLKKMGKLENVILTELWADVLQRVNSTSCALQNETLSLDVATQLLDSLADFLTCISDDFDRYVVIARKKLPDVDFRDVGRREKVRSRLSAFDGPGQEVNLRGEEKFKVETYLPIIDSLTTQLKQRSSSYKEIFGLFGFLTTLKTATTEGIQKDCQNFGNFYKNDVIVNDLELECRHLANLLKRNDAYNTDDVVSIPNLYQYLLREKLEEMFPNVGICSRIFLSLMVTNCTGERSFSKLKRIKNELRSTLGQDKLSSLSLMNIECHLLKEIDFEDLISDFANAKTRKKSFASA